MKNKFKCRKLVNILLKVYKILIMFISIKLLLKTRTVLKIFINRKSYSSKCT